MPTRDRTTALPSQSLLNIDKILHFISSPPRILTLLLTTNFTHADTLCFIIVQYRATVYSAQQNLSEKHYVLYGLSLWLIESNQSRTNNRCRLKTSLVDNLASLKLILAD